MSNQLAPPWRSRTVIGVIVVAVALIAAFTVSTVPGVRPHAGFYDEFDGWLQGTAYVVIAAVAVLRPVLVTEERLLWSLVALAVALRAAGFVVFLSVVRTLDPQPYPSAADLAWLTMSAVLLGALVVLVRARARSRSTALVLDSLLAGLTVAGLAVELLYATLHRGAAAGQPRGVVATNLAYPLIDVALLVLSAGALVAVGRRSRDVLLLAAGVAGFAVVDAVFAIRISLGTYRPGTPLAGLSLLATLLIAGAGLVSRPADGPVRRRLLSPVVFPAGLGLVSVAALTYGAITAVPWPGIVLAAAALVIGILRASFTVLGDRTSAAEELRANNAALLRYQALVDTSGDFIAIAGLDGKVLYLNPSGRSLVGIPLDRDVSDLGIPDFLTQEGIEASLQVEQPAVLAHGHWEGQSTLRDHRGGPPIPVAISSFLMRDPESGEPIALATVQRDISERLAAEAQLQALADLRRDLLARLVQAQEDERARIAGEVHDDSVQVLAAVEIRLGLLRRQLEAVDPEAAEKVDPVHEVVAGAIERLRYLLFDLESPARESNLGPALDHAASFVLGSEVRWWFTGDHDLELPPELRVTAYRIAKEAMTNVVKHAGARELVIDLRPADEGVQLTLDDNGTGFDPAQVPDRPGHLGLPSMRDRATIAGGRLEVGPRPGGGTRVRLWLPRPDVD